MSSDEDVIVLGPETVVARSQQPIPRATPHRPKAPKISPRNKLGPGAPEDAQAAPPPPAPELDIEHGEYRHDAPSAATSVIHTFYWPTTPAAKGDLPQIYRTVFGTKNHPR